MLFGMGYLPKLIFLLLGDKIKPHYRSEGPRQGSCGVLGGFFILSRLLSTN